MKLYAICKKCGDEVRTNIYTLMDHLYIKHEITIREDKPARIIRDRLLTKYYKPI